MNPNLVLTREARADIAEATLWYRERSIQAAEDFLHAVTAAFVRITS